MAAAENGWIVGLDGIAGTPAEQVATVQQRLHDAGISANVSRQLGMDGTVLVTPVRGQEGVDLSAGRNGKWCAKRWREILFFLGPNHRSGLGTRLV